MKVLVGVCQDISQFPPGHYYHSELGELVKYYDRPWRKYSATRGVSVSLPELRMAFEQAVHSHLMSDVPYGVLLSGGLDSSLVAACAKRLLERRHQHTDCSAMLEPQLHSFAIGLAGSPDLAAAEVASAAI